MTKQSPKPVRSVRRPRIAALRAYAASRARRPHSSFAYRALPRPGKDGGR